ncbi:DUF982 domain-containing protein [Rhizobium bangladeshense]|uniref:DUF982 domain-containing protein n=1 Tax=Rhizobium bangladeshense TaxID=1138189 RepID=UPI001FD9626E|nr:DUF982 domain-containing protein [Rhizobium bangladeshense]
MASIVALIGLSTKMMVHRPPGHAFCRVIDVWLRREPSVMEWDSSAAFSPIALIFQGRNERVVVRTAKEAAKVLMSDFPLDDGEEFLAAVRVCVEVMAGKLEPEKLRQAIIRAADEAGITTVAILH